MNKTSGGSGAAVPRRQQQQQPLTNITNTPNARTSPSRSSGYGISAGIKIGRPPQPQPQVSHHHHPTVGTAPVHHELNRSVAGQVGMCSSASRFTIEGSGQVGQHLLPACLFAHHPARSLLRGLTCYSGSSYSHCSDGSFQFGTPPRSSQRV